jgi:hypothetical protein
VYSDGAYWSALLFFQRLHGIVAGMLVTYPRMNVLRDSNSFSPAGAGLMQSNHAANAQPDQPYPEPESAKSPSNGRTPERGHFDAPIADEVNGLGQVCRYVCP